MYPVRHLNLHKYRSKNLMELYKINTQKFEIAETPEAGRQSSKEPGQVLKKK